MEPINILPIVVDILYAAAIFTFGAALAYLLLKRKEDAKAIKYLTAALRIQIREVKRLYSKVDQLSFIGVRKTIESMKSTSDVPDDAPHKRVVRASREVKNALAELMDKTAFMIERNEIRAGTVRNIKFNFRPLYNGAMPVPQVWLKSGCKGRWRAVESVYWTERDARAAITGRSLDIVDDANEVFAVEAHKQKFAKDGATEKRNERKRGQ